MAQVLAVDGDGHIFENSARIIECLEEPHREYRTTRSVSAALVPLDAQDRFLGDRLWHGNGHNAAEWIEALDRGPMEWTVLYPTLRLFVGFLKDPGYQTALCRAYNTWLAGDVLAEQPERIKGVALLPALEPDAAPAQLRRAKELGFLGGMFVADGTHLLGHRAFDELYRTAAELEMPIAIHASGSSAAPGAEVFPKFIQAHAVAHPYGIMRQFTSMMFEGVFDKFPTVRFAFLETGATWVPWWLDRLDEEYEHRGAVDAPLVSGRPSSYVHEGGNIFFSCESGERMLPQVMELLGNDLIMYASDFPHWDGEYPESLHTIQSRTDLSEAQRHGLLRGAAERFYGLS